MRYQKFSLPLGVIFNAITWEIIICTEKKTVMLSGKSCKSQRVRGQGVLQNDEPHGVTAGIYVTVCDYVQSLAFDSCATVLVGSVKLMTSLKVKKATRNLCSCLRVELLTQVLLMSFVSFCFFSNCWHWSPFIQVIQIGFLYYLIVTCWLKLPPISVWHSAIQA